MKKLLLITVSVLLFSCSNKDIIEKEFEPSIIESYPLDSLYDDTIFDKDFSKVADWITVKANEGKIVKIDYKESTNEYVAYIIKDTCNTCQ